MKFLKIENPGVCPPECFTLLGVSTTRNSGHSSTIGQYGSGSKYSITLLMREGLTPTIFSNKLRMEFETVEKNIDDGLSSTNFNQIVCKLTQAANGNDKTIRRTENLGWTLEHGIHDWNKPEMACREYVANAIDRSLREGKDASSVVIEVVEENQIRAKEGTTRVFIPYYGAVVTFHNQLRKRFLHFTNNAEKIGILNKEDRNIGTVEVPCIYKKGVFIRELTIAKLPSLFDYNLGNNFPLDECRNANDWTSRAMVTDTVCRTQDIQKITYILKAIRDNKQYFETHELDTSYLVSSSLPSNSPCYKLWQDAWNDVIGNRTVISSGIGELDDFVTKKGYDTLLVPEVWKQFLMDLGIPSYKNVLSDSEQGGKVETEVTPDVNISLDKVWNLLLSHDRTQGKTKPVPHCFKSILNGGSKTLGYYMPGTNCVYIKEDINTGQSKLLLSTMLEEVVHYVTGAKDCTRDIQDFLFNLVTDVAL